MWYKIDFNRFPVLLQLTSLRKTVVVAFLQALFQPLVTLHYRWQEMREMNLKKIENTWQVCYMRGALNDRFDPELRRIYIDGDGGDAERKFIYTAAEQRPKYLGKIYLNNSLEAQDTGADFIVYVPAEIYKTQSFEIEAEIDFYRLGGMNYLIIRI